MVRAVDKADAMLTLSSPLSVAIYHVFTDLPSDFYQTLGFLQ